ncbi:MAG: hypothetical protein QHJ81_10975 [Anaerolineae bacterium]|nr:hypothetical protein [Anaerolineae bacterium]
MNRPENNTLPRVVVLYNDSAGLIKGEARDMLAERGVIACAQAVAAALPAAGYQAALLPFQGDVEQALAPYSPRDWVIFNLAEGLEGRLFEEARIAWALEAMGYRFTGADGDALARSTHKAQAKACLAAAGIPTPPWRLFRHPDEVAVAVPAGSSDPAAGPAATALSFPLIVKPVAEDASLAIGPEAVVHTVQALRERVDYVVSRYRQAALAEQFIAGREFNISLWGDPVEVLPLAEVDFAAFADPCQRIVSFDAKWEADSFAYRHTPVVCPAVVAPALEQAITAVARRAWAALGCRGYARVDIRLAGDGTPYVLEVNCNPDISPDAGFFRAAQTAGYDYTAMVARILEFALKAQDE